ncbi:MAG: DUF2330 domain-containing protein [Proteobacteria bacterium]|nr:DUF2330 domain-containing protein [Pseudomonadota bacterium]
MPNCNRLWPLAAACWLVASSAEAFCGFYVAKADASLFNRASQVVLVRDGDRTVLTMANDYQGEPSEFAMVIPVPTFLERGQIRVADAATIAHLDAFTGPRLVEYFDPDPCAQPRREIWELSRDTAAPLPAASPRNKATGVTVEASYTVGESDIQILSAEESSGLLTFLQDEGYRLPDGAEPVLASYLKQGLRFFVARVNLAEQERLGFAKLRPLQIAYESPRFMLPIRLGMVNADGPQDLVVYALTRRGRVEATNYPTRRLPTGQEIPVGVRGEFGRFYRDFFAHQVEEAKTGAVFLEYAWDMSWCDPCAADPLTADELRELGVFWAAQRGPAQNVFVTRLHVRYDAERFPADLAFQTTGDRSNFQARYVLRHAFDGDTSCSAGAEYRERLAARRAEELARLASLTGWDPSEIARRYGVEMRPTPRWWERLFRTAN